MPPTHPVIDAIIRAVVFVSALAFYTAILYLDNTPAARVAFGLLVLPIVLWPIVWATRRLAVSEFVSLSLAKQRKRRFQRLRAHTKRLLYEIRRLNWLIVDAERGFRSREEAKQEAAAIQERMKKIIDEIPAAAGQLSQEEEGGEGEEL